MRKFEMDISRNLTIRQLTLESRHQLLVESIRDYAIYMLTPGGVIVSWNAGAQHFKGYTSDEIIGRHFSCFYAPEDQAAGLPDKSLQIAAAEGNFEAEGWRVRKDGSRFWAHVVIDAVRDESGELVGFAKITRDMTEKKAAQEALHESEERFRLLVKGVTDYAICMLSATGEVTDWNTGAQRIKGYTEEEIIGTHFSRFYTEEDNARQAPATALKTAIREGNFESQAWRVRKDGSRFWAHVVIDPVYDSQGNMIGFAKITRDITEQRKAAEMLEQANAALLQSRKMEAIGKLTGGIAHDFNNLLAGIMGNLDLMRLRIAQGQLSGFDRHLDAAMSAVERSAALTHRLLAFARRQTLAPKPIDVTWLINSMMDLFRRTVGPNIEIESTVQNGLWWALCDQNQLENALLNLVINARDAMPASGKVVIKANNMSAQETQAILDSHVQPGEYVMLSVTDTGAGMTPEVMEHAFEPFFTTKAFGKGTGLGLSTVHGFMNQSGGYITIDSEAGKGTTVNLYFPKHQAASDAPAANTSATAFPAADNKRPANKRLTVVVVDDEPTVRTMLTEMLQQFGHDSLAAADAPDGLRTLESTAHVDLLITDIGLPGGMNGRQLANAARRLRPNLKVLLITGYAEQSVIGKEALPPGMRLLIKPFAMDIFTAAVQSMTEDAPARTAA
jgi:PAS domain S-box-containing protein